MNAFFFSEKKKIVKEDAQQRKTCHKQRTSSRRVGRREWQIFLGGKMTLHVNKETIGSSAAVIMRCNAMQRNSKKDSIIIKTMMMTDCIRRNEYERSASFFLHLFALNVRAVKQVITF